MKMMLKMILGTCLLGFVHLAGMTEDAKKVDGKISTGAPKRRSNDKPMGSTIGSCNEVVRLHTEAINAYLLVLEDADGNLKTFTRLDEPARGKITQAKEHLLDELKKLDKDEKDEFVLVVKALHNNAFQEGNVETLAVRHNVDKHKTDSSINNITPSSTARVIMWSDEFFVIERLRAIATVVEKSSTLDVIARDALEKHTGAIRDRLKDCEFLDIKELQDEASVEQELERLKKEEGLKATEVEGVRKILMEGVEREYVTHSFSEDVTILLRLVDGFGASKDETMTEKTLAERLRKGANVLAKRYLIPVL